MASSWKGAEISKANIYREIFYLSVTDRKGAEVSKSNVFHEIFYLSVTDKGIFLQIMSSSSSSWLSNLHYFLTKWIFFKYFDVRILVLRELATLMMQQSWLWALLRPITSFSKYRSRSRRSRFWLRQWITSMPAMLGSHWTLPYAVSFNRSMANQKYNFLINFIIINFNYSFYLLNGFWFLNNFI